MKLSHTMLVLVLLFATNAFASLTDNSDSTVTDSGTHLMWQQTEGGYITWEAALSYCEDLTLAGYSDWRLPNRKELESLVDDTRYYPAIDTTKFPNAHSQEYWSSTTYVINTSYAWSLLFHEGGTYEGNKKTENCWVRCVRSGQ